ncbi:MAG: hypothetical protein N2447_06455 [Thermoanaerobaculum sp.]|nr:hypothetical protein [Thermoanaerobaculum sp.]
MGSIRSLGVVMALAMAPPTSAQQPAIGPEVVQQAVALLERRFGPSEGARIRRGVQQVAARWWAEDGDAQAFLAFCQNNFEPLSALGPAFARLEEALEQVEGHLHEVRRELLRPLDLDTGPVKPVDQLLAQLDLASHLTEDLFRTKVAHWALLNFPLHTLEERLREGPSWDRETWARSRLMDRFALRVPAQVGQKVTQALLAADQYIASYNIPMDLLCDGQGEALFPQGLNLISHWGLRDELKAWYGQPGGLQRQRLIQQLMRRIVRQEVPQGLINSRRLFYDPFSGKEQAADGSSPSPEDLLPEPNTRYRLWLANFHALRAIDPYSPTAPSALARSFELERQIPEAEVERVLVQVLAAPEIRALAKVIAQRLGRPLEPFDLWYAGFASRAGYSEEVLNRHVRARYPSVEAFQKDLPQILKKLGFSPDTAAFLAERIVVDPARGAGHALGAVRRQDRAHLRTRVAREGMDFKGFNIAVHELGHNVEQVFSLHRMDRWALAGVPNNAFTEAFAFAFQSRDLELLGLNTQRQPSDEILGTLWATYEIAGVSLVDLRVWRWLYAHPQATPESLKEAVLSIAREVWNEYFADVLGEPHCELLAIYSHMVAYPLYLSDYALGHIIGFQIGQRLRAGNFAQEVERMTRLGRVTPDLWLKKAVNSPLSAEPLLQAARQVLQQR